VEKVIVLRCNPKELLVRLQKKGWNREKIKENLEAEMLDIILCESISNHGQSNVFEIDTTSKDPESCSDVIIDLIQKEFPTTSRFTPGSIDWSAFLTQNLLGE
jgi:adenylate kinase